MSLRLEKARHLYENLLFHASEIVRNEDDEALHMSPSSSRTLAGVSPHAPRQQSSRPGPISADMVISLQEEIERLRAKLSAVLASSDDVQQQCLLEQEASIRQFQSKEAEYKQLISLLQAENDELRQQIRNEKQTVQHERSELMKAIRLIDRLKERDRDLKSTNTAHHLQKKTSQSALKPHRVSS